MVRNIFGRVCGDSPKEIEKDKFGLQKKTQEKEFIHRIKFLKWHWASHLTRKIDNRWSTKRTQWYLRGVERPGRRRNLSWDDIRKQASTKRRDAINKQK